MTEADKEWVRDLFDTNLNITIAEIKCITGLTTAQIKSILLS